MDLVPFWVLPLCFVFSNVYLNAVPRPLLRFLAWAGGLWMGFLYYSVLGMALFLVAFLVGKLRHWPFLASRAAQVLFAGTVLLVAVGCWQALHPVVRKLEYATDKNIPGPYRIVFVSDLHFGGLFGTSYGETLVRRINEQKPDLVLLGGDMVDGDLPFVLQEGSLGTFRSCGVPTGSMRCLATMTNGWVPELWNGNSWKRKASGLPWMKTGW